MGRVMVAGVVSVCVTRPVDFRAELPASERLTGQISVRLASTGWTVARTLQALGSQVRFATYVGTDPLGYVVTQGIHAHDLAGPTVLACPVQPRTVVLHDRHGRTAGARDLRFVADQRYPAEVFAAALADSDCELAVLTNIGFTRPLIDVAANRGLPIATDLHLAADPRQPEHLDWMCAATVLAASHAGLTEPAESWISTLWQRFGTELVLLGCGAAGVLLGVRATGRIWQVDATTPRGLRYPNGAGDTLLGAFLHHYLGSGDPVSAVRHAALAAGWKVGGTPEEAAGVPASILAGLVATQGLPAAHRLR
ncbi:MAG TPA: carbohydrate kinase family protein [Pseudonocardiaceae bacterium]|jgi:sugar/nucleoside kinase (ribokinase family)|nr:carbohydrate kinase family protein [Pseudonocardiaceae bacterium]